MCEATAVVVSMSIILRVEARFCIHQAHTVNKVGHHSKKKSQGPCEIEYEKFCLSGGECYYLVDEDIVRCNCLRFNGVKRCEK